MKCKTVHAELIVVFAHTVYNLCTYMYAVHCIHIPALLCCTVYFVITYLEQ